MLSNKWVMRSPAEVFLKKPSTLCWFLAIVQGVSQGNIQGSSKFNIAFRISKLSFWWKCLLLNSITYIPDLFD